MMFVHSPCGKMWKHLWVCQMLEASAGVRLLLCCVPAKGRACAAHGKARRMSGTCAVRPADTGARVLHSCAECRRGRCRGAQP